MTLRKLLPLALLGAWLLPAFPALSGTPTTNYALSKPAVAADADTWGTQLNTDLDSLDSILYGLCSKAGASASIGNCTMTGTEVLASGTTTLAPLKFQAGSLLTSPVAHAFEWDGAHLWITQSSGPTRKQLAFIDDAITGSAAKWTTGRTITLTGNVTGVSGAFDGSGNLSFATTIPSATVTSAMLASGAAVSNIGFTPANAAGQSFTGAVTTPASATGGAGFTLTPGVAPTSPTNGNCWLTAALVACRINGTTITLGSTGGTGLISTNNLSDVASASTSRTNLAAAASGANSDITSLAGLTTPLSLLQGGVGSTTAGGARTNLGAAASGANTDITSTTGSAAKWTTGRTIAFSGGDVTGTTSALDGSGNLTAQTLTIAAAAVTNAKMANEAASTVKCNSTGSPAAPSDCSVATVNTLLNVATTTAAGTVKIATPTQIEGQTDNTAAVTTSGLINASITSGPNTLSSNNTGSFTPGFAVMRVQAYLICTTAINGYSIGDVVFIGSNAAPAGSSGSQGVTVYVSGSLIKWAVGGNGLQILRPDTQAQMVASSSNFGLYIQAWPY